MNYIKIKDISKEHIGKEYFLIAQVKSIRQTSGPTIFDLKDNTGIIKATAFLRAGERAFPNLIIGNNIQAKIIVKERLNNIELEILSYEKINQEVLEKVNLEKKPFLIQSEKLEKLRPLFIESVKLIETSINENRPIIIRHHDDVDGYVSGFILEKAILPLIKEINPEKSHLFLKRISSRTPFYDYIDALRDLNDYLEAKERFDEKPPLIILTDLGSNNQSYPSLKRLTKYDCDFIIIDHHKYDKENKEIAKIFLNPHVFEFGSDLTAGSLCCELAFFINPELKKDLKQYNNYKHLPALSSTADKSEGFEYEEYLKLSGFDKEKLKQWAIAIDYDLYHLKFNESSDLLNDLFIYNETREKIIQEINYFLNYKESLIKKAIEKHLEITEINNVKILKINRNVVNYEYIGTKLPRICHDLYSGSRITLVISNDSISFRADELNFSLIKLIDYLKEKMPYALIDGGGHDFAGTIKFAEINKENVLKEIQEYLKKDFEKII
ncbi:MAG: hypothetical protein QXM96_02975 [Candidatus Woesearchaeota archaeon]